MRNATLSFLLSLVAAASGWQWALSAQVEGAKALFENGLKQTQAAGIGMAYSIQLKRDGMLYSVDSRFPFKSGDSVRFFVRPNIDGYISIDLRDQGSGKSVRLFPQPGVDENGEVQKGQCYLLPRKGELIFDNQTGQEELTITLSHTRVSSGMENSLSESQRSVIIKPKEVLRPSDVVIDERSADYSKLFDPISGTQLSDEELKSRPAMTVVAAEPGQPLSVQLHLMHRGIAQSAVSGPPLQSLAADKVKLPGTISGASAIADKWAVVIGIAKFKDKRWDLRYPDKDAADFANFLTKECSFAPDHVKVLVNANATRENILTEIGSDWLPRNAGKNDLVCIFFATHGTSSNLDVARKNFLLAYDSNPENPFATGIEIQDLARTIARRLDSQRIVLILDTCHAGAAGAKSLMQPFEINDFVQGSGQLILASADANQTAMDSLRYPNGIFTKHLIDGLRQKRSLHEAFTYIRAKVEDESVKDFNRKQSPVLRDAEWHGADLKIAVPPLSPRKPAP